MSTIEKFSLEVPPTDKPRVVVIGGGFAGINVIRQLRKAPVQIVLLDKHNYHTFQPMLYQVATSGLEATSISEPLRRIFAEYPDFHFRMMKVQGIRPETQEIETLIGRLHYDYLVIANGTKPNYFGNKNIEKYAMPLKFVTQALDLRSKLLQCLEKANMTCRLSERKKTLTFVIVGAGPTGVEVAGALAEMRDHVLAKDFSDLDVGLIAIYLIGSSDRVLPGMSEASQSKAQTYLEDLGVKLMLGTRVTDYDGETVRCDDDVCIEAETLVWGAGVKGDPISGIPDDSLEKSKYLVDDYNQVVGCENVYAIGDIACLKTEHYPQGYPGVAQVAIQQGRSLGKNLRRSLRNRGWKPFRYRDKGTMATIGRNKAVVDLPNGMTLSGTVAWLTWAVVHLYFLVGFRNKAITLYNWLESYLTYDRGTRLILKPYQPVDNPEAQEFIAENEIGN